MKARFDGSHYVFANPLTPSERIALTPHQACDLIETMIHEMIEQDHLEADYAFNLMGKINDAIVY